MLTAFWLLFTVQTAMFFLVDGRGRLVGLHPVLSLVLAGMVGVTLLGMASRLTMKNHRRWPLLLAAFVLQVAMFGPLIAP